jgi:hypothetical protein
MDNADRKLDTLEIKLLINVARNTAIDEIKNSVIPNELNVYNLNYRFRNVISKWNHHIARIKPEPIPKQLMDSTPRGTRPNGPPKLCW